MIMATIAAVPAALADRRLQGHRAHRCRASHGTDRCSGRLGVGMGILSAGDGATVALTDDGVLRSVLGMAGYLTADRADGPRFRGSCCAPRPAASAS